MILDNFVARLYTSNLVVRVSPQPRLTDITLFMTPI
jgi:hypothetical protein